MNLFNEFLKLKGLEKEYEDFVKTRQSEMKNLQIDLNVMIGDADFYLDMTFIITKDDETFLKAWLETKDDDDYLLSTGYESHEKEWDALMLKRLFIERTNRRLEGDDYCMGTDYSISPTDSDPGDYSDYFYEDLQTCLEREYENFDEKLTDLFKKTSFYKYIKEEN